MVFMAKAQLFQPQVLKSQAVAVGDGLIGSFSLTTSQSISSVNPSLSDRNNRVDSALKSGYSGDCHPCDWGLMS